MNFDDINEWLKDKKNIWVIGEREWSAKLAGEFFDNHKKGKKYQKIDDKFKGVFLLQSLPEIDDLENCSRLYFFNEYEQLFALKDGKKFLVKNCNIKKVIEKDKNGKEKSNKIDFKTITNIKYPKEYYKFKFASQINVIPEYIDNDSIFVILDEEKGEWRFSHE